MMADNLQARGPRDRDQINIHESSELRYWSNKFEVEPKYVRQAVLIVGPRVKDVEEFLWKTSALRAKSNGEASRLGRD
jgi:hypothetical protein